MPLRHQASKNHKYLIINWLHLVKLSVLSAFVVKNGFSEWAQVYPFKSVCLALQSINSIEHANYH